MVMNRLPRESARTDRPVIAMRMKMMSPVMMPSVVRKPCLRPDESDLATTRKTLVLGMAASTSMDVNRAAMLPIVKFVSTRGRLSVLMGFVHLRCRCSVESRDFV